MNSERLLRTNLYKRFGVFHAREVMISRGVTQPAEQIQALAFFLENHLGTQKDLSLAFEPSETVNDLLSNMLDNSLTQFSRVERNASCSLAMLALHVQSRIAWDCFADFAQLLTVSGNDAFVRVAEKLRKCFHANASSVGELADSFVVGSLPDAVRRFDLTKGSGTESKWLEVVFYRYCLKRIRGDLQSQRQLADVDAILATDKAESTTALSLDESLQFSLKNALQRIPEAEQSALELYFGLERDEHTLAEIGISLSCSPYHARAAVLQGLARLSVMLRVQGSLEDDEYNLLSAFFGKGNDLATAAIEVGASPEKARQLLARSLERFSGVLRDRTTISRWKSQSSFSDGAQRKGARKMAVTSGSPLFNVDSIRDAITKMKVVPSVTSDEEGHAQIQLQNALVKVSRIRTLIRQEPGILRELQSKSIALDWLAIPDADTDRADIPDDRAILSEAFDALAHRSASMSRVIADLLADAAAKEKIRLPDLPEDEFVRFVQRALGGVSIGIEASLPRSLRRTGKARFRIERRSDGIHGEWEESESESVDLVSLILNRASLLGDIDGELAELFANVVCDALFDGDRGDFIVPRFRVADLAMNLVWLAWYRSSIDEELISLR